MNPSRKFVRLFVTMLSALWVLPSHALGYPNKTITIVVPYPPGGGSDTLARVLANSMRSSLNATVIVENKPGATGNIAMGHVARMPADGYTLIMVTNSISINQAIDPKPQFHAVNSFTPIALLSRSPVIIVGRPDLPFKTMPEMLAYARSNPGKLNYGSCGNGSIHHLSGEIIKKNAGVSIMHIPYKGCTVAATDLLGGQLDISVNSLNNVAAHIKSGKMVPYAVTTAARSTLVPTVPTVQESGVPNFNFDGWYGMLAPAGTPKDVIAKLGRL